MAHYNDQFFSAGGKVHGTAYTKQWLAGNSPVGKVGRFVHLQTSHNRYIHMPAPDHGKGIGAVKITAARKRCYWYFPCINRVIHCPATISWRRANTQHPIFCMQDDAIPWCNEIGY